MTATELKIFVDNNYKKSLTYAFSKTVFNWESWPFGIRICAEGPSLSFDCFIYVVSSYIWSSNFWFCHRWFKYSICLLRRQQYVTRNWLINSAHVQVFLFLNSVFTCSSFDTHKSTAVSGQKSKKFTFK